MLRVGYLIICTFIMTSQAQYKCRDSTLQRRSCGRLGRFACEARGCCYDEREPSPYYKCSRNVEGLSFSFKATNSPALSFGGEPGYPGNKIKRGCFPFFRKVSCDVRYNAMDKSTCERWGCCWDEGTQFCHKSFYNIIRLRKTCPPGFSNPPGCDVTRCEDSPCMNGGICNDLDNGFECQCVNGTYGSTCADQCIPQAISNGFSNAENRVYLDGESVEYFCNLGYRTDEDRSLVCNQGVWEPAFPPNCVKKSCPAPPSISDGSFSPTSPTYQVSDQVTYTCDDGHLLVGAELVVCLDLNPSANQGSWFIPPIGCTYLAAGPDCNSLPCLNGGFCLGKATGFECVCQPCCTGAVCEIPLYCFSAPCLNGGTCTEISGGYLCQCPPNATGTNCEIII